MLVSQLHQPYLPDIQNGLIALQKNEKQDPSGLPLQQKFFLLHPQEISALQHYFYQFLIILWLIYLKLVFVYPLNFLKYRNRKIKSYQKKSRPESGFLKYT